MANALVTGGTGFIGLHLVEALVGRGDCVRCLVRSMSTVEPLRTLGVELLSGDVDDMAAMHNAAANVDVVFHVAGIVRAYRSQDFYDVNERGTATMAIACAAQAKPPRLIVVSSIAA